MENKNLKAVESVNGVNNDLNKNDMVNEQVETSNSNNKATTVANNTDNMDKEVRLFTKTAQSSKEEQALTTTVIAVINGTEVEITPAFTGYSMEQPKKNKEDLLRQVDHEKLLNVIFHFAEPETFWKEGMTIFDRNGMPIEKGTSNVYVACDTADSYWRLFVDERLTNVEIHKFSSVKDFAQTIGNTMLLSRGLNNVEKIGVAALATGNEAYKAVFEFSKKHAVPMNTAQLYFDMQLRPATTQLMMLGKEPKLVQTLGRSVEVAEELFEQATMTFSKGDAKKRYAIRVVNRLLNLKNWEYETLMEVLRTIPANELAFTELIRCEDKESCIQDVLTEWMHELRNNQSSKAA